MKTGRKRMFWMVSILLAACLGIALSACESKGQQPDSFAALSTIIAVFENIVAFAMDLGWSRKKAVHLTIP